MKNPITNFALHSFDNPRHLFKIRSPLPQPTDQKPIKGIHRKFRGAHASPDGVQSARTHFGDQLYPPEQFHKHDNHQKHAPETARI